MGPAFGVNKPHPAQAALAAVRAEHRLQRCWRGQLGGGLLTPLQKCASPRDIPLPPVVGQDAEMTNADQARRKNVHAERTQELPGSEGERFDFPTLAVI